MTPQPELDPRLLGAVDLLTRPGLDGFKALVRRAARNLVPNPPMGNRAFIERHVVVPNGSRPGPMKLDVTQAAVADALDEPENTHVVALKPPRGGFSTFTSALFSKKAAYDGENTIFYERSDGEAQNWHDKKLRPMLEASPYLRALLRPDSRSGIQDSWSDIYLINGAALQQRGVQTDSNFKAIQAPSVGMDEAGDPAFKGAKGSEGTKVGQAETRFAEYAEPHILIGGTPTTPDCVVVLEWEKTDKRTMRVPFPCCGRVQEFLPQVSEAGTRDEIPGAGLKFRCETVEDLDPQTGKVTVTREVTEIGYQCAACGVWMREDQRNRAMEEARYVPTRKAPVKGHVGFYWWAIHSRDPAHRWPKIVEKYLSQRANPSEAQEWTNLWLAQAFVADSTGVLEPHKLAERCEPYAAPVPDAVVRIYGAWDSQRGSFRTGHPPRHEGLFWGVGPGREVFILGRFVVDGVNVEVVDPETGEVTVTREQVEPFSPDAWRQVLEISTAAWRKADGTTLTPSRVAVDIGYDLNRALQACNLAESRKAKIVPVKGRKEAHGSRAPAIAKSVNRSRRDGLDFINLGTQSIKDTIHRMWGIRVGEPESIHAPLSLREQDDFWQQVTAERLFEENKRTWWDKEKADAANEALDLMVYCYAAMCLDLAGSAKARRELAADVALIGTRPPYEPHDGPDRSAGAEVQQRLSRVRRAAAAPGGGDVKRKRAKAQAQDTWERLPVETRRMLAEVAKGVEDAGDRFEARLAAQAAPAAPAPAPAPAAPVAPAVPTASDRAARRARRSNSLLNW